MAVAVAVVLVATLGVTAVAYHRLSGNIDTFDPNGLSRHRPPAAQREGSEAHGTGPVNVLAIGSDSRAGENERLGGGAGAVGRSDTTILVHVYADRRHAVAVSIPRDLLVDIPPCRLPDGGWSAARHGAIFNEAFSMGGTPMGNPACTQNTVEKLTGLRVDHTIVANFRGFAAITRAVDGVRVCLPAPVYEGDVNPNLGYRGRLLFQRGVQRVSGKEALDYVRLRHGLGDGSDIGRMARQQAFLASLAKKIKRDGLTPGSLWPLADAATRSLTVDRGLDTPAKLISFAVSLRRIRIDDITFVTVPWHYVGYRVGLTQPAADRLWAALRTDRPVTDARTETDAARHRATSTPTPTPRARPSHSPRRDPRVVPTARSGDDSICSRLSSG